MGMYSIDVTMTTSSTLKHPLIHWSQGREKMDHALSWSIGTLLPNGLTDMGFCSTAQTVTFTMTLSVWIPQYQTKPEGRQGISETPEWLLQAQVLWNIPYGDWNTRILPAEKKGTGKHRMVHDLRAINSLVGKKSIPVPNPHTALTQLSPEHKYFSCIDLANAFFFFSFSHSHMAETAIRTHGCHKVLSCLPACLMLS